LTFARSTSGGGDHRAVDLARIVARECEERTSAGHAVRVTLPADPVIVSGDAGALARVAGNLVDNALKYGSEAEVSLTRCGEAAELLVDDRGAGIVPADRERIFEPFLRLEGSRNREGGGSGLGLAIARQVIDSHLGTITVEDRPGGGARFRVALPLAAAGALAGDAPAVRTRVNPPPTCA
jgi:signal transduction histidine kinase